MRVDKVPSGGQSPPGVHLSLEVPRGSLLRTEHLLYPNICGRPSRRNVNGTPSKTEGLISSQGHQSLRPRPTATVVKTVVRDRGSGRSRNWTPSHKNGHFTPLVPRLEYPDCPWEEVSLTCFL